jgi:hypothetical protein
MAAIADFAFNDYSNGYVSTCDGDDWDEIYCGCVQWSQCGYTYLDGDTTYNGCPYYGF